MYTIHIQYALLPNATLPLISLRQNDKKNKLCALNFSLSFMTFIKNNGFYMKILWYILKFPEISGELSGELQPAKKFSSPTPAKSDFLLSAEISWRRRSPQPWNKHSLCREYPFWFSISLKFTLKNKLLSPYIQ